MMTLYEVTISDPDTPLRCFAWANNVEMAHELAMQHLAGYSVDDVHVRRLFDSAAAAFCTTPAEGGGWDGESR